MAFMGKALAPAVTPVLAVLALMASPGAQRAAPTAADLAQRIQAHYDTVRDFRAGFKQTYISGALGEKAIKRGAVRIKKRNRMYWKYDAPANETWVADGSRIFHYDATPGDPSCTVNPIPEGDQIPQGVMFLAGRGSLVRDFTSTAPASQADGTWQLDLIPHTPQDDFTALTIIVDRKTLALESFITTDREGNTSRFDFSALQENAGLSDAEFTFTPPRGVKCEAPNA
jgi:outer membrane lipoprotein carrier protein